MVEQLGNLLYHFWQLWALKYLAQGHKHADRSGGRTHIDGLVITSPAYSARPRALKSYEVHACKIKDVLANSV